MSVQGVIRAAGEGQRRWFSGGGVHTWKVTAEECDGAFFVFEDDLTQGKTTPWHCHPHVDELAYLLEGEVDVNVGGTERRVSAGGMWMSPRGVPHAFIVVSPTARMLCLQTPGTSQAFYWDASDPMSGEAAGAVDFERIHSVAASTGATDVLGPPPFATA